MKRYYSIDYLKGLAAVGIMVYHLTIWETGPLNMDSALGRFGIFGVAIFYIVSGLTLYLVYEKKFSFEKSAILQFIQKRFIRIYPLLWLVTFISIYLRPKMPAMIDILLNLTGLFGFVKWEAYLSTGAWSIGNVLAFYILFILSLYIIKKVKYGIWILGFTFAAIFLYFTFVVFDPTKTLPQQWTNYVNPLNQYFYFFLGMLMGYLFQNTQLKVINSLIIISIGVLIFVFYPANGDAIKIIYGWNRIVFLVSCLLICFGVFKISGKAPGIIHSILNLLGEISFTLYLMHPIVYVFTGKIMLSNLLKHLHYPPHSRYILTLVGSVIISYLVANYYEKFFANLLKK
ncbi:MAG: acyltransferase [Cytophagaceae bacterium]|nr:acyltransferase [Cytophagaceae bacterium]MBK9511358.1 acyltransferase [Cytophagaceae bacterium]MBK9932702.1 acyltransferase [Cytophagaceae bacterium]MBL0303607.1 acyltransferase [Cytophagaceae bacterium]MBL0326436.1 acyltransferase [Cytophagaceae bacterium]